MVQKQFSSPGGYAEDIMEILNIISLAAILFLNFHSDTTVPEHIVTCSILVADKRAVAECLSGFAAGKFA